MKKLYKNDQQGRSMVEMLGVLAIIGVLSVGGIAGYSKAMGKFKITKMNDQITTIVANIRTAFANQTSYESIDNESAIKMDAIPSDMLSDTPDSDFTLTSAYGNVVIEPATKGFTLTFDAVPEDACMFVVTSDWGSESSGLVEFKAGAKGSEAKHELPLDPTKAVDACEGGNITLIWNYF